MKEGFFKLVMENVNTSPFEHFTHGGFILKTSWPTESVAIEHDRSCPAEMHLILGRSYATPLGRIVSMILVGYKFICNVI